MAVGRPRERSLGLAWERLGLRLPVPLQEGLFSQPRAVLSFVQLYDILGRGTREAWTVQSAALCWRCGLPGLACLHQARRGRLPAAAWPATGTLCGLRSGGRAAHCEPVIRASLGGAVLETKPTFSFSKAEGLPVALLGDGRGLVPPWPLFPLCHAVCELEAGLVALLTPGPPSLPETLHFPVQNWGGGGGRGLVL